MAGFLDCFCAGGRARCQRQARCRARHLVFTQARDRNSSVSGAVSREVSGAVT